MSLPTAMWPTTMLQVETKRYITLRDSLKGATVSSAGQSEYR